MINQDLLRVDIQKFLLKEGLTKAKLTSDLKLNPGNFSGFLGGKKRLADWNVAMVCKYINKTSARIGESNEYCKKIK